MTARRLARARRAALAAAVGLLGPAAAAQVPDSLAARALPPDSVQAAAAVAAAPSVVVADTAAAPGSGRALRRSLLVPGWGQITNGEPAKAPVALGAVVGAGAFAAFQHGRYLDLRHAFLYRSREEAGVDPNPFERFREDWEAEGELSGTQLRSRRDAARGRRDIAVLIVGVAYALQALDAYVSAELAGFDVGDDLALVATPDGPAVALRVRL